MMQLLCNGVQLDLYADASMQFTQDNPLFSFDNLKCERTTEFALPKTKTNDEVFALARVLATNGEGMRRKFSATLQMSGIVKEGYLYVSSFDEDYKAIFVTGELVALQRVKDAGSARKVLQYDANLSWSGYGIDADTTPMPDFALVMHEVSDSASVSPSVSLQYVINQMANALGVNVNWANATGIDKLRVIAANECKLSDTDIVITRRRTGVAQSRTLNNNTFLGLITLEQHTAAKWSGYVVNDGQYNVLQDYPLLTLVDYCIYNEMKCAVDCALTFPNDLPTDCFVVSGDIAYRYWRNQQYHEYTTFLGGYKFNEMTGLVIGTPLRGRTITIPANTPFTIVRKSQFAIPNLSTAGVWTTIGFDPELAVNYDIKVTFSSDHKFKYGENTPYNAILPDMTMIKLLQIAAACTGTILNYSESSGFSFDELAFGTWNVKDIDSVLEVGEMSRVFADYKQNNIVQFKDDDGVYSYEKLRAIYTIDNVNLEEEKKLQTIELSEGGLELYYEEQGNDYITKERILVRGTKSRFLIAKSGDDTYLLRTTLPKNSGLQALCTASTKISVQARLGMLIYDKIAPDDILHMGGLNWVWTNKQWHNNIAKFTLAKV